MVVKSDITSRKISPMWMMRDGRLPILQDSQALDFVRYRQTTEQVATST